MIRAVTIDIHGTLMLPTPSIGAVYAERAATFDLHVDGDAVNTRFHAVFVSKLRSWGEPYGANDDDAREFWHSVIAESIGIDLPDGLADDIFAHFAKPECWHLLPNAHEALATIRAHGCYHAIASNFDSRALQLLEAFELGDFDDCFLSTTLGAAKPKPTMLEHACRAAGCEAHELLHIGDHPREDGGAARACGCAWLPVDRESGIDHQRLAAILAGDEAAPLPPPEHAG